MSLMHFWFCKSVFASVTLCICLSGIRVLDGQESNKGFRDFRIVEPSDLIQQLSVFEPDKSSDRNFDPNKFKDLATEGRRWLSELSREQREEALDFAEQFFEENGFESDTSKALMNRLGVPEPVRKSLLGQLGEKGSGGEYNLRDVLSDALPKSKEAKVDPDGKNLVADRAGAKKASERKQRVDEVDSGLGRGKEEAGNADISNGDFKTELESKSESPLPKNLENGKDGKEISRDGEDKPVIENGTNIDPLGLDLGGGVGDLGDGRGAIPQQRMPGKSDLKTDSGQEAEKKSPEVRASEPVAEDAKKRDSGFAWEEELNRILGVETEPTVDNQSDVQENINKAEPARNSKPDGSLKERLKDLAPGPDFMEKIMNRNSGEPGDSADSQAAAKDEPRLASMFDRTVVEAARGVLEAPEKSGKDDKGFLARNVDAFFKKIVNSTVTDDESDDRENDFSRFNSDTGGWDSNGRSGGSGGALNSDWLSPRRRSRWNLNSSGLSKRSTETEIESKNQELAATPSGVENTGVGATSNGLFSVLFGLGIGLVVFAFLLTILNRRSGSFAKIISDRAVSRRFNRANFQSSQDLISLVDIFLLNKFGSESGWWNAKYAENILLSDAPEFETSINELVRSYVRLRYTRADGGLTQDEQDNCLRTLKSLSKILSRTDFATRLRMEG